MIIKTKKGDILASGEKRIAFAINTEGANAIGLAGIITKRYWPELANIGETKIGTVLSKKVDDVEFYALTCYSLDKIEEKQKQVIKECFDAIPGNEPIASISIGFIGILNRTDFYEIRAGMEATKKEIILY